jgi:lactoylglutathione lyase
MMKYTHTSIHIKDLDKSLAFYHGILGLEIVRRFSTPNGGIAFVGRKGDAQVELIMGPPPKAGADGDRYGGFSIGITVPNLQEATEKLVKAGYPKVSGPISPSPDVTFSFFKDPDGVTVQLLQNN